MKNESSKLSFKPRESQFILPKLKKVKKNIESDKGEKISKPKKGIKNRIEIDKNEELDESQLEKKSLIEKQKHISFENMLENLMEKFSLKNNMSLKERLVLINQQIAFFKEKNLSDAEVEQLIS
jgi:hypothetical protein